MDIEDKILKEVEFQEDDMDIYSDEVVDEMLENDEVSIQEDAFMRGYNKAEI